MTVQLKKSEARQFCQLDVLWYLTQVKNKTLRGQPLPSDPRPSLVHPQSDRQGELTTD